MILRSPAGFEDDRQMGRYSRSRPRSRRDTLGPLGKPVARAPRRHSVAHIDLAPITQWITEAALLHGQHLPEHLMQRLAVSRRGAGHVLRKLVHLQWLTGTGISRAKGYRPGPMRQVVHRYPLQGLQEDLPWRVDFAPCFELPANVHRMVQHAFTELLNNAIDHSGGQHVTVSMRQTPQQVQLLVSDDGCGLFKRIEDTFDVADPQLAMLELSKGKLTSAPDLHCGRGLYFTSRLADVLDVHANHAAFQRRAWDAQRWHEAHPVPRSGTSVYLAIALDTRRTLDEVMRAPSLADGGYGFDTTHVPLSLISEGAALASRAEARRAASRLTQFRRAELDFTGIRDIGHGFADELFRVFSRDNPGVELVPLGMSPQVAAMVACVRGEAMRGDSAHRAVG
jgi:anti-sigma regulatory factor (Ser/Thr protein kinase)